MPQELIMAININNLNSNTIQPSQRNMVKQQATQTSQVTDQVKRASTDSVSLTPQAKQLSELQKKAGDAPVINQKKIEELKQMIADGNYKVNPEKLAASIADLEFKLV